MKNRNRHWNLYKVLIFRFKSTKFKLEHHLTQFNLLANLYITYCWFCFMENCGYANIGALSCPRSAVLTIKHQPEVNRENFFIAFCRFFLELNRAWRFKKSLDALGTNKQSTTTFSVLLHSYMTSIRHYFFSFISNNLWEENVFVQACEDSILDILI